MDKLSAWLRGGVLQNGLESNPTCVALLDLNGRVRFMNKAAMAMREIENLAQIEGQPWTALWPVEYGGGAIQRAIETGLRGEPARFEAEGLTRRGAVKWWDVRISPLRDNDGVLGGVIAYSVDLSQAVATRQENKARSRDQARNEIVLRAASRIAQLGGWEFDCATRDVYFSEELASAIGLDRVVKHEVALKSWHEEDVENFDRMLEEAAALGKEFTFEGRIRTPDGSIRWLRVIGEPDMVDGWCVALRGASQDVTEWRESMAQLQASEQTARRATEAMAGFLTMMSHELRTPLNGVLGMAQVMARGGLTDVQAAHLKTIQASGESLLVQLNDLLDLAKVKAGRFEFETGAIDAEEIAAGAKVFASLLQDKDVRLNVAVAASARGLWTGDAKRVGQVLSNLVSNAVKFTERGAIDVEISGSEAGLCLQVRDTGIGIPQEKLAAVFEEFVQVDASMSRRFGGSGLGLAICRDMVALMGGTIGVESAEGVGSTFTVQLPLERLDSAPGAVAESCTRIEPIPEGSLQVLAAEDNPTNQLVLKTLLETVGISPVLVENGRDAVEAWRQKPWDLVLMDIQMPIMDGIAAVRTIREAEASDGRARTPIIAVTANAMAHHRAEYLAAGMDAVVSKPLNLTELLDVINSVLDGYDEADGTADHRSEGTSAKHNLQ